MAADELSQCHRSLVQVLGRGRSLEQAMEGGRSPYVQQVCYGVCRNYFSLKYQLDELLDKPLPKKHLDVEVLLLIGLFHLQEMRIPDHAAVSRMVDHTRRLRKGWAKGLVNGILRNYLRQREALGQRCTEVEACRTNHPDWLWQMLQQSWPQQYEETISANNHRAPVTLRVNPAHITRDDYLQALAAESIEAEACDFTATGIRLIDTADIRQLPGFDAGWFAVQDEAAQLAASLLAPVSGDVVLDACAAPGGKTCHLLATASDIKLTANDIADDRLQLVAENLQRLHPEAEVNLLAHDVLELGQVLNPDTYDRILLDAPCSGTGVIRRHPDIKLLRRQEDIAKLSHVQLEQLQALWPLLRRGGSLLYATCSVLPQENEQVVNSFIEAQDDVVVSKIDLPLGIPQQHGIQILPKRGGSDGFYYALMIKA